MTTYWPRIVWWTYLDLGVAPAVRLGLVFIVLTLWPPFRRLLGSRVDLLFWRAAYALLKPRPTGIQL